MNFLFVGKIPTSKSLLNRGMIIKSYAQELDLGSLTQADDVLKMNAALMAFQAGGKEFDCGAAAAVLRFLALRVSRLPGVYRLTGTSRMLARPHEELLTILRQMGCDVDLGSHFLQITSRGWRPFGDMITVRVERSSQFISGLLLNAWQLPFDLYVSSHGAMASFGYFEMTLQMCKAAGMTIEREGNEIFVPKNQEVTATQLKMEPDLSSAFAICACAAVAGSVTLTDFPTASLQPDAAFVPILREMGVQLQLESRQLHVAVTSKLRGLSVDLGHSPDLFPVLAALAALAQGPSKLYGAAHLVYKESNRIAKVAELIRHIRPDVQILEDGLLLSEIPALSPFNVERFVFDCDQDHRLAMAAAVLKKAGYVMELRDAQSVQKSFPEFWSILGDPQ
jgi:3-phosphoshikimate 1-carboxyvinyltransferase